MNDETRTKAPNQTHEAARPLKFLKDKNGDGWLCDEDIDIEGDLEAQGCWRCGEMAFPNGS